MSSTATRLDPKTEEPIDTQFYDNNGVMFGRVWKNEDGISFVTEKTPNDKQREQLYAYANLPVPQPVC